MRRTLSLLLLLPSVMGCATPRPPAAWIPYACEDGRRFEALYPDTGTARLKLAEREVVLNAAVSASGARFIGAGVQWWVKGDRGTLSPLAVGEDYATAPGVACGPPEAR